MSNLKLSKLKLLTVAGLVSVLAAGCALGAGSTAQGTTGPSEKGVVLQSESGVSGAEGSEPGASEGTSAADGVVYTNSKYGFQFALPDSWQGYSIVTTSWEGFAPGPDGSEQALAAKGPQLAIRHPLWTKDDPRQDIPIMIFNETQWESLQNGDFHIGAAPIGPSELGHNDVYYFALPARYNYAFPTGYKDVEQILADHPLTTTKPSVSK